MDLSQAKHTRLFELLEGIYDYEKLTPHEQDKPVYCTRWSAERCRALWEKQVGALTSQERGESSACVVCVNAAGNYVPSMVIYKWKRLKIELTNGGPPGAVYSCQDKGWMSNEGFVTWLRHFVDFVKPTKEETCVHTRWSCDPHNEFGCN